MTSPQPASPPCSCADALARGQRGQHRATIAATVPLCRDHLRLELRLAGFPATFPGQFIQLACRNLQTDYTPDAEIDWQPDRPPRLRGRELAEPLAFLRRPFSLAGRASGTGHVDLHIILRVVGAGTRWLSRLGVGDTVDLVGPLGNSFELPAAGQTAIVVGGGVGIPPMLYLAEALAGRKAVAFCGATTSDLLPLTVAATPPSDPSQPALSLAEFSRHGIPAVVTTDDGTLGLRGFVTDGLERYLDQHISTPEARGQAVVYTCGPEPMMKRVAAIALERGIACQVSVERSMACGMGTCQSCAIRVKRVAPAGQADWQYKLACTDGPIFRAQDLLW